MRFDSATALLFMAACLPLALAKASNYQDCGVNPPPEGVKVCGCCRPEGSEIWNGFCHHTDPSKAEQGPFCQPPGEESAHGKCKAPCVKWKGHPPTGHLSTEHEEMPN